MFITSFLEVGEALMKCSSHLVGGHGATEHIPSSLIAKHLLMSTQPSLPSVPMNLLLQSVFLILYPKTSEKKKIQFLKKTIHKK